MLVVEDGSIVDNSDTYIDVSAFDDWLLKHGYSVADDKEVLLRRAFIFMSALPWVESHLEPYPINDRFITAQCYLAVSIDSSNESFNFNEYNDTRILKSKGLGSGAITKSWDINYDTVGADSISILKRLPFVYNLLKPFLNTGNQQMLRA